MATAIALMVSKNPVQAKGVEDYPAKPVRFIIPFAPGGATDILGRIVGREFFGAKQPVVPENVAGAGGNVAAALVARSSNDGYTLEVGAMSMHAMNGSMYKKLPFDPVKDFEPIAMLAYAINVIAVSASLPVHTFPELLAYIRTNPGKVDYASGGVGTHNHLTLALLAKVANLDIVHVPYKGGGPAVMALVQGECGLFAGGATLLLPYVKTGKVRIIAVTEGTRTALLPNVPSVSETLKGFEVTNWYGLFGPKGLDVTLQARINQEVNRITGLPEIDKKFAEMGMVRAPVNPVQLGEILQADNKMWSAAIRELSIAAE
ncbi:MAG: tripartite tricarboxylate transporter substrate-binding protein [Pseudomonadota bacterium]